jgi:hypothetical protein
MTPERGVGVRALEIAVERVRGVVNWFCDSQVKDVGPEAWAFWAGAEGAGEVEAEVEVACTSTLGCVLGL